MVSWGLQKKNAPAFRPDMELASGEMTSLGGKLLLMTATASQNTVKILKGQFPEISNWELILNLPVRDDVTILTPPSDVVPSDFVTILSPFVKRMKEHGETHLILVRGLIH